MSEVKQMVLDVLKPHSPSVLDTAIALAALGQTYRIRIDVSGVDEKTETVLIDIEADHIDYEAVNRVITELGGSVHSVDHVEVCGTLERSSA